MSIFDSIVGMVSGNPALTNMAEKLGLDAGQAEKAIAALTEAHKQDGDTVTLAAEKTGLDASVLNQIVEQIGGEGSLTRFTQMLDRDGDGNALDDIAGFASGLFGKK